jgi:hypothetical protein
VSALLQAPHLSLELNQEREVGTEPDQRCRFCDCSEFKPCRILLRESADGNFYLARNELDATEEMDCTWFVPRVCNAPACMAKLMLESTVTLFTGDGIPYRRMG